MSPQVPQSSADRTDSKSKEDQANFDQVNGNGTSHEGGTAGTSNSPKPNSLWDKLPSWISTNLRSRRSWKLFLRCWIASWVCFVILLPNKSLSVLGNAAFFALMASLMVPPNIPVQLFLFLLTTIIFGLCLGWAFGCAAMRAALAARDQQVLKASLQREQQSVAGLSNPEALFQADIFEGTFLDTRSSIVFGCFLGFATFLFALIRAYAPKLTIMSVFATIAIDVFCSYGPLFPFAQYTILNSFLISTSCYIAIGIIVILLVFPETVNHAFLVGTSGLLGQIQGLIEMQEQVLTTSPNELGENSPLVGKVRGSRAAIVGVYKQLTQTSNFMGVEFSWGKWNGEDVRGLEEPLLGVISRLGAFQSFLTLVGHPVHRDDNSSKESVSDSGSSESSTPAGDSYLLRQLLMKQRAAETKNSVTIGHILPVLRESTTELRRANADGIAAVKKVIDSINLKRYARNGDADADQRVSELADAINHLQTSLATFKEKNRLQLLTPFESSISEAKGRQHKSHVPLRSLYIAFVFSANLVVLAEEVLDLMEYVQKTALKRRRNRLWAPGGLRALWKAITSRGGESEQAFGEQEVKDDETEAARDERSYKRDPDSMPPSNVFQRIANTGHMVYKWTKTAEAMFAFKYVIVTIAFWIPQVVRSSANFVYTQKSLWALIMAQTTLNIYAADQIYNYALRLLGTFVGALLGLLNWYIGSAKSNGNPYGAAASVAVFLVPVIFFRLFCPMQYLPGALLTVVTWALVMGYSWLDGHIPVLGNVGIGWSIVWRRWLLVMIGSAGSFILMMFPPKSGRKAVRLRNASNITSLSFLYSTLISAWISDKERPRTKDTNEWIPGFRDRLIDVATQIQALRVQTTVAKWEGSIRGAWPYEDYMRLLNIEMEMLSGLALIGSSLAHLESSIRVRFLQHTRIVNPNFVADVVSAFAVVSQALRTGEPLHEATRQNLVERLHYHGDVAEHALEEHADLNQDHVAHPIESISDYDYMFYASAIVAVFQVLDGLNQLRDVTAKLCGEIPLEGLAQWKMQYERAHTLV
ncbi:hypothetical protein K474DRAFT_1631398 [Panus rudis PR-1116 ss-1]|nr:hypothetical protein K474DRAFT_1631398 [Panus rudis PR-1116 ss-1]